MGIPFSVRRLLLMVLVVASLSVLGACAAPAPLPTPPLQPTHTPAPTSTPYPTQPPLPTYTPLPTHTPWPTLTLWPSPSATATAAPEPTRPPAPTSPPVVRSLNVEWTNVHYNCQNQCYQKVTGTPPETYVYAYRTFEFNVHIRNLTDNRGLDAGWYPLVTVFDGATEYPNVPPTWQVVMAGYRYNKAGAAPAVPPGQAVDHSFIVLLPGTGMFVRSITFQAWGQTYTVDLESRSDSVGYGYKECGLPTARFCPQGMPVWDPYH